MYKQILVPIDLADPNLAKPALDTAVMMAKAYDGSIRLINVLPMTPLMLAARENELESARLLVKGGADINAQSGDGKDDSGKQGPRSDPPHAHLPPTAGPLPSGLGMPKLR